MTYRDGFLLQLLVYILIWLYDDYVGLVISLVMAAIIIFLLLFALVVEWIERSKVPRSFFIWMFISALPPVIATIFFTLLSGGNFDWLNQF